MGIFIKKSTRITIFFLVFLIVIIPIVATTLVEQQNSIEKVPMSIYIDEEYKKSFEDTVNFHRIYKYYEISYSSKEPKNADIILTSDKSQIDTSKDYNVLGWSPLIFVMNENKDLNELLVSNNDKGFLISDSRIKNNGDDYINCDFLKIVETVIAGGNWSDLGWDDEEIKIYCPSLETTNGKLFREFLIRILNNGLNETNEEIETKIDTFFASENVIQTDVVNKLRFLKNNISNYEIYVEFEHEFLYYHQEEADNKELLIIYPEKTVLKNVYIQTNTQDEEFIEKLNKESSFVTFASINQTIIKYYYRYKNGDLRSRNYNINIQEGINAFEKD